MITSTCHSQELQKWILQSSHKKLTMKISQETKSEQKTGESEADCWLLDRVIQPRGRHLPHLFQVPIVFVTGDRAECSLPKPAQSLGFPLSGASPSLTSDSFLPMI